MAMNKSLKSPCVRNCCLDNKDICLGCFRHLDEIIAWTQLSESEKEAVLELAQKRKSDHKSLFKFYPFTPSE